MSNRFKNFEYLICLDFEATCWDEDMQTSRKEQKREIIEFGAVLFNVRSGAIEDEFHEYVRPTDNPILSEYCVNLTGISQASIDRQEPFRIVYQKFIDWLEKIRKNKATKGEEFRLTTPSMRSTGYNCNATVCTWTNWDMGSFFAWDCGRHGLKWPDYLRAWIDGRKIFQNKYPGNCSFEEAVKKIKITRSGNAHSAIDDAKTLADVMKHLCRVGVNISQVTTWQF